MTLDIMNCTVADADECHQAPRGARRATASAVAAAAVVAPTRQHRRPVSRLPLLLFAPMVVVLLAPGAAAAGRELLQTTTLTPAQCAAGVANCAACRQVRLSATAYRTLCTRCETGYAVRSAGRACWCAPGYYRNASSAVCEPCGRGAYCPGSASTKESEARRVACGLHKTTTKATAVSDKDCVALPGYAWAPGDGSLPCAVGTFSPGLTTSRRCQRCPGSLTTAAPGAAAATDCKAPKGFFYRLGTALPCGEGTYKDTVDNADCTRCPEGWTTPEGLTALTAASDCNHVIAGFYAPASARVGVDAASLCPPDFFRAGDAPYNAAAGTLCAPCPPGMRTRAEGAASADECLAPPGWGFNATTGEAAVCPLGWYSDGWGREPCVSCGGGAMTTAAPGAEVADECLVPAGHFTTRSADGLTLSAAPCPVGTWGRPEGTFGLVDLDCAKCPEHSTTRQEASTDVLQCLADPGYGYDDGGLNECAAGSWSRGGAHEACTPCGEGYTTSANGVDVITGATGPEQCIIAPGWTPDGGKAGGLKPCVQGFYKSALGPSACVQCPSSTTTSLLWRATSLADCDACQPGFSNPAIDAARPACSLCPSGTFSIGRKAGGSACEPCPKPVGFSGRMVSRRGSASPEACVPEFSSDGADNDETWDLIPMDEAAATAPAPGAATVEACQAACAASPDCQYFSFRAFAPPAERCRLRDRVAFARVDLSDETQGVVFFEVAANKYVGYPAHPSDAASLGVPLGTAPTRADAERACNAAAACIGFVHAAAANSNSNSSGSGSGSGTNNPWRLFGGALWPDVTAKIKATGESINPWVALPSQSS